eukprot:267459-Chlamydomonas_euryale.AAC.4
MSQVWRGGLRPVGSAACLQAQQGKGLSTCVPRRIACSHGVAPHREMSESESRLQGADPLRQDSGDETAGWAPSAPCNSDSDSLWALHKGNATARGLGLPHTNSSPPTRRTGSRAATAVNVTAEVWTNALSRSGVQPHATQLPRHHGCAGVEREWRCRCTRVEQPLHVNEADTTQAGDIA